MLTHDGFMCVDRTRRLQLTTSNTLHTLIDESAGQVANDEEGAIARRGSNRIGACEGTGKPAGQAS